MPATVAQVVFPFEDVSPALDTPPIAARRALDVAGLRLAADSFRSLPRDERIALAQLGLENIVDVASVERIVRRASPPATRAKPAPEPDPTSPPEQLNHALGPRKAVGHFDWLRLRPVERYALVHVMRRAIAHDDLGLLELAVASVLPHHDEVEEPAPARHRAAASSRPPPASRSHEPARPLDGWANDARAQRPSAAPPPAGRARTSQLPPPLGELMDPPSRAPSPSAAHDERAPRSSWLPPSEAGPSAPPRSIPPLSSHLGPSGEVHMVDVGAKPASARRATASGVVRMRPETAHRLARNDAPKGEVLATARIAGILAAKRTPEIIPLCHHVALAKVEVHLDVEPSSGTVTVTSVAEAVDRTGVEMEALVATSVACLTIYDMLKGIDRDMVVGDIKLLAKTGGKHGPYEREI